ncbi:TadE/TadG family type IV pilus assembly protein [Sphingomonas sp. NIC1]|uniref:TadE/TadG family type IV pilus assembly protein n=1 Tax=Sphingomonas sp. NIC1 TaxID=1961362 RepID=UPI0007C0ECD6|nr:TadE/TadG family type IV pilus assembly protein [Sphingomonas sp. NIC1]ANC88158.1 hypothetical protein A7E77_15425 [Sphingomonas sp. NIC1]
MTIDRQLTDTHGQPSFLSRFARAKGGNTLAMLAAFLIPMSALTGSAVDFGRMYLVKVRLQQACDAGALAGRKAMADSSSTTLDPTAAATAKTFFANNFPSGIMGTPAYTSATVPFTPTKTSDNQVAGTASVRVPTTVMKMFGMSARTMTVTCEARFDVADSDVMFVLDTTGSMACTPANSCTNQTSTYTRPDGTTGYYAVEATGSKISGLRSAVLSFFDTMEANKDSSTRVRYGFVTYTSTVNAGFALPSSAIVDNWTYQSRKIVGEDDNDNGGWTYSYYSGWTNTRVSTTTNTSRSTCDKRATGRTPALQTNSDGSTRYTFRTDGTAEYVTTDWNSSNGGTCNTTTVPKKPSWQYMPVTLDLSQFKLGNAVVDPSKVSGATAKWQGCLEERDTTSGATTFDQNNLPPDLDPDALPTSDATRWRPMWPEVTYYRNNSNAYSGNVIKPNTPSSPFLYGDYSTTTTSATVGWTSLAYPANLRAAYVSCGKPVRRLGPMTRTDVSNYVNADDFKAQGGTYHDTGMIWGTRLLSPTGLFASDTAAAAGRQTPNRYIVFMTDGDMAPNAAIYGMYGLEAYDGRVANGDTGNLTAYHNARFLAECTAAKARNITVFVIGFGQTLTPQLTQCASPGQAFYASDNASLDAAFRRIANQVALLRVSK